MNIIVKLLLSIDRRSSVTFAADTVQLAKECMLSSDDIVIGIDLSGDPVVLFSCLKLSLINAVIFDLLSLMWLLQTALRN